MKKLTVRNFAAIKRIAQNVNPLVVKKNRMLAQAKKILLEVKEIEEEIKGYEAGVVALTGGYQSEALVTKVVENTGKVDKDNTPIKVTKYIPTNLVTFNEEENCYYIPEFNANKEEAAPVFLAEEAPAEAPEENTTDEATEEPLTL